MLSLIAFSKKTEAKERSLLMFLVVSVVPLLSISSFTVDLISAELNVIPTVPVAYELTSPPGKFAPGRTDTVSLE